MVLQKARAAWGQRAGDTAPSSCPALGSCTSHYTSLNLCFASTLIFLGVACLECYQFRVGPLHRCTSNLRWAPQLFAAYVISHSSNNGPAPVTCDTYSSFASFSDTGQSVPSTEEGLYVCGHTAPVQQLLMRLQALNFLLESSLLNTDSPQFLCHSSFTRVPFSCHFLC